MSVSDFERGAVFRPGMTLVVKARGGDVGMPEPRRDLGDVGLVLKGA